MKKRLHLFSRRILEISQFLEFSGLPFKNIFLCKFQPNFVLRIGQLMLEEFTVFSWKRHHKVFRKSGWQSAYSHTIVRSEPPLPNKYNLWALNSLGKFVKQVPSARARGLFCKRKKIFSDLKWKLKSIQKDKFVTGLAKFNSTEPNIYWDI